MDYEKYDKWVKEGQKLFGKDKEEIMYSFLYGINNFISMPDAEVRRLLFKRLKTFEVENIKQISSYTITNLDKIIGEIRHNLITNSHLALYFLINSLAERICDGIIQYHNEPLDERDKKHIVSRIEVGKFFMEEKIVKVEKIMKNKGTTEGQELVEYLKLLKEIRNTFMFHFLDNNEYLFLYPKEREEEKDKNLLQIFQKILDKSNNLLSLLKVKDEEKRLIEVYGRAMENVMGHLKNITYSPDVSTNTSTFYRSFSEYFTHISYSFIFFIGRENLRLFK